MNKKKNKLKKKIFSQNIFKLELWQDFFGVVVDKLTDFFSFFFFKV